MIAAAADIIGATLLYSAAVLAGGGGRRLLTDARSSWTAVLPVLAFAFPAIAITLSFDVPALAAPSYNALTAIGLLPIGVVVLVLGARGVVARAGIALGALLIAAQSAFMAVFAALTAQGWLQPAVGALLFIAAGAVVGRRGGRAALEAGGRIAMLVLLVAMALGILIDPATFLDRCRTDKCSVAGVALVQGLSGNGLGMFIAAAAPLALLGLSIGRLIPAIAAVGLFVDLTSGRAAMLGFVAAALLLLLGRWRRAERSRVVAVGVLVAGLLIASIGLLPWGVHAFTDRGQLWAAARRLFPQHPVLGWGPSYWTSQPPSPNFPNYGTHNAVLELLVSGGIVGTALVIGGLVLLVVRSGEPYRVVAVLTPIVVAGALESTLAPHRFTILFGFIPLVVAVVYARQPAGDLRGARRVQRAVTSDLSSRS